MLAGNDALLSARAAMDGLIKRVSFDSYQQAEAEEWDEGSIRTAENRAKHQ